MVHLQNESEHRRFAKYLVAKTFQAAVLRKSHLGLHRFAAAMAIHFNGTRHQCNPVNLQHSKEVQTLGRAIDVRIAYGYPCLLPSSILTRYRQVHLWVISQRIALSKLKKEKDRQVKLNSQVFMPYHDHPVLRRLLRISNSNQLSFEHH